MLLGSLVFILYLDRVCIAKAEISIREDLQISKTQMSYVFGAFTFAYGLFEVPTGRWGDRFGSRGVLTRIVLCWSAFTALTGCVWRFSLGSDDEFSLGSWHFGVASICNSFVLLMLIRFLFGAGEAGALPNIARVVARWVPAHERGWTQGIILTCMQLGAVVSPVVANYLIAAVGWRWTFVVFGCLGVVWGTIFYLWFRDDPDQHPAVNTAERALIARGTTARATESEHPPIPWGLVLSSLNVWLLGLIISCSAFASYMYMFWLPTYLIEGRRVDSDLAGWLAALALGGGALGALCGGPLSTLVVRWTGERRWSRRLLGFTLIGCAGLFLGASVFCDTPVSACLCISLACLCGHAQLSNWWAVVIEISGRHLGALFGLMNSMGVPGAFLSPIFLGTFADYRKAEGFYGRDQWDPAFFLYAGLLVVGASCWLLVDPTKSAVEPAEA
jgi:MFS family permease